ncbi:hypothetical protein ES703_117416 [subsurface metagenome]
MMEEFREFLCPACGHVLGFRCKNEECGNEDLEMPSIDCDICGGEMELRAFLTDSERKGTRKENLEELTKVLKRVTAHDLRLVLDYAERMAQ